MFQVLEKSQPDEITSKLGIADSLWGANRQTEAREYYRIYQKLILESKDETAPPLRVAKRTNETNSKLNDYKSNAERYSSEYDICNSSAAGSNPKTIECQDMEISATRELIQTRLNNAEKNIENASIISNLAASSDPWSKYMNEKCKVFLFLEGQRGNLLARQCILDEYIGRLRFINEFLTIIE